MAWITTDTDVAYSLVVEKRINSEYVSGYPKTYNLLYAFTSYPTITVDAWHKMEAVARNSRISAFKAYIGQLEGINVDNTQTNSPYRPSSETPGEIVEP